MSRAVVGFGDRADANHPAADTRRQARLVLERPHVLPAPAWGVDRTHAWWAGEHSHTRQQVFDDVGGGIRVLTLWQVPRHSGDRVARRDEDRFALAAALDLAEPDV